MPPQIPRDTQRDAEIAYRQLSTIVARSDAIEIAMDSSDVSVRIPPGALFALVEVLSHMARGHGARIVPVAPER